MFYKEEKKPQVHLAGDDMREFSNAELSEYFTSISYDLNTNYIITDKVGRIEILYYNIINYT